MKYIDRHVHTRFSPDSNADIVKYINKAKELELEYILFTDHIDFGTKDPEFMDFIDFDEYIRFMKNLERQYEIPIKIGVEIGYEKNHKKEIDEFLNTYKFDFIISSIHYGNGMDFYMGDFFVGKTKYESYMDYFKLVLEMVENFKRYDVVGHMDYISRYGPYRDKDYEYEDYKEIIDDILKAIIKNNKGMEVNTSGLRGELRTTFPKDEVLLRYKQLGGKHITVGSDCHFNQDYRADFEDVIRNLNSMGFIIE
ncbi:histidinol-phosphatase HisJ family protein [Tissierella creatinini]|nr:histidinol-phosphatase HisJ family protein [Tissierella creatinini]TJX66741.1 histidinol-phosphatase HisJ family protein [Soehngenia saccharolytica]